MRLLLRVRHLLTRQHSGMGLCSSCRRSKSSKTRRSEVQEDRTQVVLDEVLIEKTGDKPAALSSGDKPKPSVDTNLPNLSKEKSSHLDEGKIKETAAPTPASVPGSKPGSKERMTKKSEDEQKKIAGEDQKRKKKGKAESKDARKEEKKGEEDSGSEVIDYWLTSAERMKPKPEEVAVPANKPGEADHIILSVARPPSLQNDFLADIPATVHPDILQDIPASPQNKKLSIRKPPQDTAPSAAKGIPDESKQPKAYGVIDRPVKMTPSARKPVASQAYGVVDRPMSRESLPEKPPSVKKPVAPIAYGIADRPMSRESLPEKPPSVKKPVAPIAYGIADRPMSREKLPEKPPSVGKPVAPKAYGIADRPMSREKLPEKPPSARKPVASKAYGIVDRPVSREKMPEKPPSVRKPVASKAYGIVDRPMSLENLADKKSRVYPMVEEAYGVMDRPVLPQAKTQMQDADRQGMIGKPQPTPQLYHPKSQYSSESVPRPPEQQQRVQNTMGSAEVPRLKQMHTSPPNHSYRLYGDAGYIGKSGTRSEYRY
uniref:Collagen alpha-3(VI) chain isoform 1 n=1 Tax=Haemonchus contortus TaxID=6289 RepID=W6NQM1_HAECO